MLRSTSGYLLSVMLLGFFICLFNGCEPLSPSQAQKIEEIKKDPLISEIIGKFDEASSEFRELSKPNKVEAWVDNLIIKAQPGKDMPQVGTLKQGERAEYLYQRTRRKSEFMLRNQKYYEPWILIRNQQGLIGWVHQGGVKFVDQRLEEFLSNGANPLPTSTRSTNPASRTDFQDMLIIPGQRVGNITVNTSEKELMRVLGPGNISQGSVSVSEDRSESATIIYGNTRDELFITWKDNSKEQIKAIYILKKDSRWMSPSGLHVGMQLSELTKINEAPVDFYGFNWEYGGTVENWNKGRLSALQKFFYVSLKPEELIMVEDKVSAFSGKKLFSSNTEGVLDLYLIVDKLVVYLD